MKISQFLVGLASAFAAMLLAACYERTEERGEAGGVAKPAETEAASSPTLAGSWRLLSSGEGTALRFAIGDGPAALHLFCPARSGRLLVNVPAFKPIASEERLSFGSGGTAEALVADSRGDTRRGGVTGEGPVPAGFRAMLAGQVFASYGAQKTGPHPAPVREDRSAFFSACHEIPASPAPNAHPSACRMQDGTRLTATALKALGTEPFWGARIKGRCVTYSTLEDQKGTRIWTRFTPGPDGGVWSGALDGRPFELRTRPAPPPGCSDGMSDRRYGATVTLRVGGETRHGCAEPDSSDPGMDR